MRACTAALLAALVALSPLSTRAQPAPAQGGPRAPAPTSQLLSQDEVIRRALATSTAARAARARSEGAGAQAKSLRGRLLPGVSVSEEWQRWDSPFAIAFPGVPGSLVAREQTTSTFTASAGQPLLGLLHLGADLAALGSLEAAAGEDVRTAEAAVKESATNQLLGLFEARALRDVAQASVAQLEEQLQTARARLQAGVITRADALRIETAAANARQQVIQAEAQEESARAALLVAIGEAPFAPGIEFAEPLLPEPGPEPEPGAALQAALTRRPEVASARLSARAAGRSRMARTFDLLPEVNAEAAYLHLSGQIFQPEDSAFVGMKAEWPIWDWGAKWYARSAASAQADAAAAQYAGVQDQVSVEVAARLAGARAAGSAVAVARTAIASAEEAYRVTDQLVKAGSSTTTDLLDAQAALTTARSNLAQARYNYAAARVTLARVMGEL